MPRPVANHDLHKLIPMLLAALVAMPSVTTASAEMTALRVRTVHVGNGETLSGAVIVIEDGDITAVGTDLAVPDDVSVIDLTEAVVTPGLIDANAWIEPADLLPPSRTGRSEGDFQGRSEGRPNLLHSLLYEEHDIQNCAACDGTINCRFAAAHSELEEDMVCPVCGYPGSVLDHLDFISGVRPGVVQTETSSEIVPHTHVLDAMNLRSPDFDRLLRGGVTTVFISPDKAVVIGPRGALARTGGPLRDRVIRDADAVTAAISSDAFRGSVRNFPPSRFRVSVRSRRPNTRMGLTWVFRKAFFDAQANADGRIIGGADTPPEEALPVLQQILEGEIPFRMHARTQNDILTSIRLAEEFGLQYTLLEATEAYKTIDELRSGRVPVVFGPIYVDPSGPRARSFETRESRLGTIRKLLEAGIDTALSAQDLREEDGLARQMMYAVRAGVSPQDALRAVTSVPARLIGLEDRLGTLEPGKQADLVVWSANPWEAGATPQLVMIDGSIVLDRREPTAN